MSETLNKIKNKTKKTAMTNIVSEKNESEKVKADVRKSPEQFINPDDLHKKLIETILKYHPSSNLSVIEKAYDVATKLHKDQRRKSGEPYIIHPISVAIILADLELDKETIAAALLHDVIEDTEVTYEDIEREFGSEIAQLVDGVTKLTRLKYQNDKMEIQAENLRKMFLAMAEDIRVILIKLADRLHNMRTLEFQSQAKQIEKSRETLEIYAPLAHRLGISKIKIELEDLSMKYMMNDVYAELTKQIEKLRPGKEKFVEKRQSEIAAKMEENNIDATITGRVKHFFSIYRKMITKNKTLDQIFDIFAVRIIVKSEKDCYTALGIIHDMYTPIPGRIKDYIAMPKPNMYQSLHTTLMSPDGQPFEVQIRTEEMHKTAEYGIAAHWKYKEGTGKQMVDAIEDKLSWLRQILEWQKEMSDNKEFITSVKNDLSLLSDNVYCFTPSGDVKNLPAGSCPIDFAYSVHTAVGNTMAGARVNDRLVPIDYKIQNGDRIEIITSQNSKGPSRDWLKLVKSTQARNKINQWFKREFKEENIVHGRALITNYCKSKNIELSDLMKEELIKKVLRKYGFDNKDALLAAVGHGSIKEAQVVHKLVEEKKKYDINHMTDDDALKNLEESALVVPTSNSNEKKGTILVNNVSNLSVHLSKCCHPVPGDEIIGYVTRGRGITIHRTDCINVLNFPAVERERLIPAEWSDANSSGSFNAHIRVVANNRIGLLIDISAILTDAGRDVKFIDSRTDKNGKAILNFEFEVENKEQLVKIANKIRSVKDVLEVNRAK